MLCRVLSAVLSTSAKFAMGKHNRVNAGRQITVLAKTKPKVPLDETRDAKMSEPAAERKHQTRAAASATKRTERMDETDDAPSVKLPSLKLSKLIDKKAKPSVFGDRKAKNRVEARGPAKSGRSWKEKEEKRSSLHIQKAPAARTWSRKEEKRQHEALLKAESRALKEKMDEERAEEARKAKQRRQQKEENQKKALVVQPITDTRKIKKMSKKQLKQLIKM